jgi:hypothetical protein
LDWNGKNAGKCLDEIVYEQYKEKLAAKQLKVTETEAKVNLNAEIDAIVAEAQAQSQGLPSKSKRERVSNIKENRRNERAEMKPGGIKAGDGEEPVITQNKPSAEMSPGLRKIRQKMEERLKNE